MFAEAPAQQASAWLPTVVTAVLLFIPALLGAVVNWWRDLGVQAARLRVLDEAKKTVEFWEAWIKTCDGIGTLPTDRKRSVLAELDRVSLRVSGLNPSPHSEFYRAIENAGWFSRRLFLFKSPNRLVTRRRLMFYIAAFVYPCEFISFYIRRPHVRGHAFSHWWQPIVILAVLVLIIAPLYLHVARTVNAAIEESKEEEREEADMRQADDEKRAADEYYASGE